MLVVTNHIGIVLGLYRDGHVLGLYRDCIFSWTDHGKLGCWWLYRDCIGIVQGLYRDCIGIEYGLYGDCISSWTDYRKLGCQWLIMSVRENAIHFYSVFTYEIFTCEMFSHEMFTCEMVTYEMFTCTLHCTNFISDQQVKSFISDRHFNSPL